MQPLFKSKMYRRRLTPAAIAVAVFSMGALSAADSLDDVSVLKDWDYTELKDGWSAEEIMDTKVFDANGKETGSVENLLINEQGKVIAVIAEVGGFRDISDTHVAVPWEEVTLANENVILPISKDKLEDYSLFREGYFTEYNTDEITAVKDDLEVAPKLWHATSLLDDYAILEDNIGFGYVDDLIFNDNGRLESVVINVANPDYGYYAYPWYGYEYGDHVWKPGLTYYTLPFTREEMAGF